MGKSLSPGERQLAPPGSAARAETLAGACMPRTADAGGFHPWRPPASAYAAGPDEKFTPNTEC
jgi:hypothetical protein